MARFYEDVPIQWKEGETTYGRGLGNHVAWALQMRPSDAGGAGNSGC